MPVKTPCDPRNLEEVLDELLDYKARCEKAARKRQEQFDAVTREMNAEIEKESIGLLALIARFKKVSGAVQEELDRCVNVLQEISRNPALPVGKFNVDTCTADKGEPCPPGSKEKGAV